MFFKKYFWCEVKELKAMGEVLSEGSKRLAALSLIKGLDRAVVAVDNLDLL